MGGYCSIGFLIGSDYSDGSLDPYVTVHYVSDPGSNVSPTLILGPNQLQLSVTIAAKAPTGMDYVLIRCADCDSAAYAPVQIIGCAQPTITSVTPSTWFAGKSCDVTITGTNFVTQAANAANPACPITPLTVTVGTGNVTVTDVQVNSATQNSFIGQPDANDPTETATITVGTTPNTATATAQIADCAGIVNGSVTVTNPTGSSPGFAGEAVGV